MYKHMAPQYFRRLRAHVGPISITQVHLHNPYIIAWWSAAFPGFGHILLSKKIRGFSLFIWEIFINNRTNLNLAIVYSFSGNVEMAKEVLDMRWILLYIPLYIFAIWDSYRTAVDLNKVFILAEHENAPFQYFSINALEINYLDRRNPIMAVVWSLFVPGLGQLYIHRVVTAVFLLLFTAIFIYFSKILLAVHYLFQGNIAEATAVIDPQWVLFFPSHYGFSVYDAYKKTVENNKLFKKEQITFFQKHFQNGKINMPRAAHEVK